MFHIQVDVAVWIPIKKVCDPSRIALSGCSRSVFQSRIRKTVQLRRINASQKQVLPYGEEQLLLRFIKQAANPTRIAFD